VVFLHGGPGGGSDPKQPLLSSRQVPHHQLRQARLRQVSHRNAAPGIVGLAVRNLDLPISDVLRAKSLVAPLGTLAMKSNRSESIQSGPRFGTSSFRLRQKIPQGNEAIGDLPRIAKSADQDPR
jgi:hypothetical protein